MVVIGGLGSISGAAIAAILLTLLPEWLRDIPPGPWGLYAAGAITLAIPKIIRGRIGICVAIIFSIYASCHYKNLIDIVPSDYRMVIYALLLIVMMIVRPQGLFGVHEIWDYLPARWHFWNRTKIED